MFDWLEKKPDHPMYDAEEAVKLLANLPAQPEKALEEITGWLTSVKETPGFRLDHRVAVIQLLDERGQPHQMGLLKQFLAAPDLRLFKEKHLWQAIHDFWSRLGKAYAMCVTEYAAGAKAAAAVKSELPVVVGRAARAMGCQMRTLFMGYHPVPEAFWTQLYGLVAFAETAGVFTTPVHMYAGEPIHNTVQTEILKVLMLDAARPDSLAPEQVELAYRTASRFVGSCVFGKNPGEDTTLYVDLAKPLPPHPIPPDLKPSATVRYFGGAKATPKMAEMAKQNEEGMLEKEQRLGVDFSSGQKVTALKHLIRHWGLNPPHREASRTRVEAPVEIVHGYSAICTYITHIEASGAGDIGEDMQVKMKKKGSLGLTEEQIDEPPETWSETDASDWGIGVEIPQTLGKWVKVGTLCAVKIRGAGVWWVGIVRRMQGEDHGKLHCGIQILSKKPVAVWLRVLGGEDVKDAHWEATTGSFSYEYLHAVILPETAKAGADPKLVIAAKAYVPGHSYEVMAGESGRFIRLTEFLEQGEDYDLGGFQWQKPAAKS